MSTGDFKPLLDRARQYDPGALAEIYDQYAPKIYNYIYYRVGDARQAEDLTASVFLNVLEAIQSNRAWRTSFFGLVVSHCSQCRGGPISAQGQATRTPP